MPDRQASRGATVDTAKILVILLAFTWGFNWIATAIALRDIAPWSLRFIGSSLGLLTLFAVAKLGGHNLHVPRGERLHVLVAGFANVAAFQLLAAFSQLSGATSRTIIITYSMPIWAAVLSWLMLRERLDRVRVVALVLCVAGIAILVWPLLAHELPVYVFYSLGCAFSWSFATVYIKWARVTVAPVANATWQLAFGLLFITAGMMVFEGYPQLGPAGTTSLVAALYVGVLGVGLAHYLWWAIVGKLSAVTASIGALLVPVIGVSASALVLGERLTIPDMIGFVLIFCAAACVLLQPSVKPVPIPD